MIKTPFEFIALNYIQVLQKHQQICFHSTTVPIMYFVDERLPAESAELKDFVYQ